MKPGVKECLFLTPTCAKTRLRAYVSSENFSRGLCPCIPGGGQGQGGKGVGRGKEKGRKGKEGEAEGEMEVIPPANPRSATDHLQRHLQKTAKF